MLQMLTEGSGWLCCGSLSLLLAGGLIGHTTQKVEPHRYSRGLTQLQHFYGATYNGRSLGLAQGNLSVAEVKGALKKNH